MRGDTIIDATPQKIVDRLADLDKRKEWDSLFQSRKVVKMISDEGNGNRVFISHMMFDSPNSMVTPRDFSTLTASTFDKKTGNAILLSKSIVHKDIPEQTGYVRGDLLNSGYIIQPNNPEQTQCKVTYIVQLDPKGWIPMPIVSLVSKQQPMTLARLRDFITKQ